jgi:hypothetical protein
VFRHAPFHRGVDEGVQNDPGLRAYFIEGSVELAGAMEEGPGPDVECIPRKLRKKRRHHVAGQVAG